VTAAVVPATASAGACGRVTAVVVTDIVSSRIVDSVVVTDIVSSRIVDSVVVSDIVSSRIVRG
jgi:hypothetical protein